MQLDEHINTYGSFLRKKYGHRVFKAGVSTGIQCPHRDESGGCIFCLPETYNDISIEHDIPPIHQLEQIIPKIKKGTKVGSNNKPSFLAYFHSGTATAGDRRVLEYKFLNALKYKEVCGLVISTRPDYIDEEILSILNNLPGDIYLELGLQSIHNKSLKFLNRGHEFSEIEKALELCDKYQVRTGVHLILGIPGEDKADLMETISYVNGKKIISEVKLHNLVVYQRTPLAGYSQEIRDMIPEFEEYIELLGITISFLRPDIVIGRLFTSNVKGNNQALNSFRYIVKNCRYGVKRDWMNRLVHYLKENNIIQGIHYEAI